MDIINDVPYVEQGEFIGLFKIEFQRNEHESYAALISNATLEAYGITKDELYDQAKENDKKNTYKQPILCDINDIIFNIIAGEKLFDEKIFLKTMKSSTWRMMNCLCCQTGEAGKEQPYCLMRMFWRE